MLFWEKIKHVWKHHHDAQTHKEEDLEKVYGENGRALERGDVTAMVISAFLVLVPAVLLARLVVVGIGYVGLIHCWRDLMRRGSYLPPALYHLRKTRQE